VGLGLQGSLDGLAGQFASAGDGQGLNLGQNLAVGGFVGGLLELAGQEESLLNDEGFERRASFKGAGLHGNLLV
jgi:hypothetical protein